MTRSKPSSHSPQRSPRVFLMQLVHTPLTGSHDVLRKLQKHSTQFANSPPKGGSKVKPSEQPWQREPV